MPRSSSTLIYLAIALGLVCYLVLIDKKIPGTKEQEDSENQLFEIRRVRRPPAWRSIMFHGTLIFQKKGDNWEIVSPISAPADTSTIEEVLNEIANAQPQRVIHIDAGDKSTPATLKDWGLSPAAERAIIHTKTQMYELLVGRRMALNDTVYSRASGKKNAPVRMIPNLVKTMLEKDLPEFRSRSVFDFDANKVVKVSTRISNTATTPAQECEVDLKDHKWTLQKPLVARAAESDVQSLLTKILALHVTDFVTDAATNLSPYGLTSPNDTVSVTVQPQEELLLQIGGPVPNKPGLVYAQRLTSSSVFSLEKSSVDEVLRDLPSVRDRHVMPFDPATAQGLAFSFSKKSVTVRNVKGLWNTTGTFPGRADVGKVTDLLTRLSQLQTTPVLKDSATDLKPFGLDKPTGKIIVQIPGSPALTLLIGKDENKLLYVQNSIEPFIYTLPENAFDFFPPGNLGLLDARVLDLPLTEIKVMTITAPPAPAVVLTRSLGGTWTASNLKDRMVDSIKADTLASLFGQLLAQTWLGPAQPSYQLNKPVLIISASAGRPHPTVLRIGATLPDGSRAAEIEGNPNTFSISEGDYGILNSSSLQTIPSVITGNHEPSSLVPAPVPPAPPAVK